MLQRDLSTNDEMSSLAVTRRSTSQERGQSRGQSDAGIPVCLFFILVLFLSCAVIDRNKLYISDVESAFD